MRRSRPRSRTQAPRQPGAPAPRSGSFEARPPSGETKQASGPGDPVAASTLPPLLRSALCVLLQAWDYAVDCQRNAGDFAVEIQSLRQHGLTQTDLRWLVCKGLVTHGTEDTTSPEIERSFHPVASLAFTDKTCFILTTTGVSIARQIAPAASEPGRLPAEESRQNVLETNRPVVPQWDSGRRELRWASQLVKRYRLPAPNQEAILAAFEEEGWPPRIDDPLPHKPDQDPKQRLHDTIKSLNRHQVHRLLVFKGDGTCEGVQWQRLD
jgi:hypothetical protein